MRARLTAVALIACTLPGAARGGGFTWTTFGGRRTGMAANVARPDDLAALFHNPAGLADQPGLRFHASALLFTGSTEIRMRALDPARFPALNPAGCGDSGAPPCPWPIGADGYYTRAIETGAVVGATPFVGASLDLGSAHPRLKKLVLSAAVYLPDLIGGAWADDSPAAYHVIDATLLVLAVSVGAGWRIDEHLAVGAALSYHHMRLNQSRKVSPTDALTPPGESPGPLTRAAQVALGDVLLDYHGVDHGLGWVVGVLFDPLPWLSLGLSYNGATAAHFEGDLALEAPDLAGGGSLEAALRGLGYKVPRGLGVEQPLPHALFFGVNLRPAWWLELGLDYRVWLYSLFDEQRVVARYDADDPGEREVFTAEQLSRRLDYDPSHQLSAGVLLRPLEGHRALELLAGVMYDTSPVPDETFTLDVPSLDQIMPSIGVRWQRGHWRLWASYTLSFHLERDVRTSQTSPPTNVTVSGLRHNPALGVEYIY